MVAAPATASAVRAALGAGDDDLDAPVVVLDPVQAKGLEFDAVVLVEPAEVAAGESGASDLYVAMTRPTQRLVVVHARELPEGLTAPEA
ncbi:ATP-binding domain-containing protein [Cellulosimicrobium cellulans]|uniref:ATP-binding domain-containing protein n=1 Tax=Cellulosimicrobium cellulans TaxID=1710 RepID=UPI0008484A24